MLQSAASDKYWGRLYTDFPEYQTAFVDEEDRVVAAGMTIPLAWDSSLETLPDGWEAVLEQRVKEREANKITNAMSALEAVVEPALQGRGLSMVQVALQPIEINLE